MGFHVGFKVVTAAEELAATFDVTLEVRIFLSSESLRLPDTHDRAQDAPVVLGFGRLFIAL